MLQVVCLSFTNQSALKLSRVEQSNPVHKFVYDIVFMM